MADVKLFHPELEVTITVPEESAWVRLENGWEYAEPEPPAPAPIYDTAGPPKPAPAKKADKEDR
jgi:hypothetical protein